MANFDPLLGFEGAPPDLLNLLRIASGQPEIPRGRALSAPSRADTGSQDSGGGRGKKALTGVQLALAAIGDALTAKAAAKPGGQNVQATNLLQGFLEQQFRQRQIDEQRAFRESEVARTQANADRAFQQGVDDRKRADIFRAEDRLQRTVDRGVDRAARAQEAKDQRAFLKEQADLDRTSRESIQNSINQVRLDIAEAGDEKVRQKLEQVREETMSRVRASVVDIKNKYRDGQLDKTPERIREDFFDTLDVLGLRGEERAQALEFFQRQVEPLFPVPDPDPQPQPVVGPSPFSGTPLGAAGAIGSAAMNMLGVSDGIQMLQDIIQRQRRDPNDVDIFGPPNPAFTDAFTRDTAAEGAIRRIDAGEPAPTLPTRDEWVETQLKIDPGLLRRQVLPGASQGFSNSGDAIRHFRGLSETQKQRFFERLRGEQPFFDFRQ